jgi:hypothetical protein
MDQRLARGPVAERNALVVLADGDHLMLSYSGRMRGDPLSALAHFDIAPHSRTQTSLPAYS